MAPMYSLAPGGDLEVILIASGSEVILAIEAHEQLIAEGIRSRGGVYAVVGDF